MMIKQTIGWCTFALVTVKKSKFYPFFENPKVLSVPHTHFEFQDSILSQIFSTCIDE